jgi:hypothetical protein
MGHHLIMAIWMKVVGALLATFAGNHYLRITAIGVAYELEIDLKLL